MGYTDLTIAGSDSASDAVYIAFSKALKPLRSELRRSGNTYNTCGIENVALIFYEIVPDRLACYSGWRELAIATREKLIKFVEKTKKENGWDAKNKRWHLAHYRKWLRRLDRFIAFT